MHLVPLTIGRTTAVVTLTKGYHALIDLEDWPLVSSRIWCACEDRRKRKVYARNNNQLLHRFIVRPGRGRQVDHWNNDGLDNRRENLRNCTNQQNCANQRSRGGSSRFKGVHWNRRQSIWVASIHANYGTQFLGHFKAEEDAARRYDEAARKQWGQFAKTNF